MVDKLKEKLFAFGLFGTQARCFSEDELQSLLRQKWTEVVTKEQLEKLRQSFTQVSLEDTCAKTLPKGMCLRDALADKYIRMNTIEWKNYFCPNFNFISKEYYFVFDMLITTGEPVSTNELRLAFGIEPKKMFYIVKKLATLGYVDKMNIDGKLYLKYRKNADGSYRQEKTKGKRVSINARDHSEEGNAESGAFPEGGPDGTCAIGLCVGVPLIDTLKEMLVESRCGLCSVDVQRMLGISIKKAHKLLTKYCARNSDSIKAVNEFEGKIRRVKFYSIKEYAKSCEGRRQELLANAAVDTRHAITMEDRILAIEQQLRKNGAFPLDKRNVQEIQQRCGWKYAFDRRTLIRSALKGGFNVYTHVIGSDQPRYVVALPDVSEKDPAVTGLFSVKTKISEFEKSVLRFFVLNVRALELDNGFEPSRFRRLRMLHDYICNFMRESGLRQVPFNMDLIGCMSLSLYLRLVPIRKANFRDDLAAILEHNMDKIQAARGRLENAISIGAPFQERREMLSSSLEGHCTSSDASAGLDSIRCPAPDARMCSVGSLEEEAHTCSFKDVASGILESVRVSDCMLLHGSEIRDEFLPKFKISRYRHYLSDFEKLQIFKVMYEDGVESIAEMDVDWARVQDAIGHHDADDDYIPYEQRDSFFQSVRHFGEESFYNECFRYIANTYSGRELGIWKDRLDAFRKHTPSICPEVPRTDSDLRRDLRGLIIDIKRRLLKGEVLSLSSFKNHNAVDVEQALRMLSTDKIIAGFKSIGTLENVHLHELFRRKIEVDVGHLLFGYADAGVVRDDYYHNFYNMVYHAIITSGSIEKDILLKKVDSTIVVGMKE
ncbi:UNVERIFIED_CONTAM: hypothetical protein PYX00_011292 [Menopon gallinae]|uniref:Uncharacterized protein n=1 Tax=Menopon gallinae TaxID=328185 RepID=A0AAW2H734_9NEOP